jgi:nucleotide-binding universal stress UspA family protein
MYKRALVPLDGSPLAEAIIPFLMEIAGSLEMSIVLLGVREPIPQVGGDGVRHPLLDVAEAHMRETEDYLASIAAALRARGLAVSYAIRSGRPDEEIVQAAREAGVDLIAMSTHGRSGLDRLLFGSVAEQVLRHADVPVLMMRQTPARLTA